MPGLATDALKGCDEVCEGILLDLGCRPSRHGNQCTTFVNKRTSNSRRDPSVGWPGERHVLLHSLSHALINELALECGYASASIRERIYAKDGEMAGILLYTAAPDAEGTLGGLVALARPEAFGRLLDQAIRRAALCSTDPMCASHEPEAREVVLHGAAYHACLFVPETSCGTSNRLLHRSVLTETLSAHGVAHPFR